MTDVPCDLHADPFRVVDDMTNGRGTPPEGGLWTMAHSCTSPSPSDVVYTVNSYPTTIGSGRKMVHSDM